MSYDATVLVTSGLVSYWKLDEISGTTAADAQGANAGTYTGGYTLGQVGVSGNAVLFNGTTGYVTVPDATSLHLTGTLSLEAWVKTTATAGQPVIIGKYPSGTFAGYGLSISSAGKVGIWVGDSGGGWFFGNKSVNNGFWHHVVVTLSGTTVSVYVDGALDVSGTRTSSLSNTAALKIGTDPSNPGTSSFSGTIDAVALYNVALPASTIQGHYEAVYPPVPPPVLRPGVSPRLRDRHPLFKGEGGFCWPSRDLPAWGSNWTTAVSRWGIVPSMPAPTSGGISAAMGLSCPGRGQKTPSPDITLFMLSTATAGGFNQSNVCPILTGYGGALGSGGYALSYPAPGGTTFDPKFWVNGTTVDCGWALTVGHWYAIAVSRIGATGTVSFYAWDYDTGASSTYTSGTATNTTVGAVSDGITYIAPVNATSASTCYSGTLALAGFTPTAWTETDFRAWAADPFALVRPESLKARTPFIVATSRGYPVSMLEHL